jgi:hypothetical protein
VSFARQFAARSTASPFTSFENRNHHFVMGNGFSRNRFQPTGFNFSNRPESYDDPHENFDSGFSSFSSGAPRMRVSRRSSSMMMSPAGGVTTDIARIKRMGRDVGASNYHLPREQGELYGPDPLGFR